MRIFAALAAVVLVLSGTVSAHDVPDDVVVQAFLRPEGHRLRLLVRVPLTAMRDVDVPTRARGAIDLDRVDGTLRHAATLWITQNISIFEDGRPLGAATITAARVSLPSDRTFQSYDTALAQITGPPLPSSTDLVWEQGAMDALIEYPIQSDRARLSVQTDFQRLAQRVTVAVRLVSNDGAVRAFEWHGNPGRVEIDPRWYEAARSFAWAGITHVLGGADHLLFLLCVAIPLRRVKALAIVVTSFTVAHATTLIAAAYGFAPDALWFAPLVETLIAVSIVWMALENIVQSASGSGTAHVAGAGLGRRWAVTTMFGLVHGVGFSFALQERLQFAGSHLLASLLAFNLGVEIAQLAVILAAAGAVALAFRFVVEPRLGAVILSAMAAHTGWHWMIERAAVLQQFPWPGIGAAAVSVAVWVGIAGAAAGTAWAVRALLAARLAPERERDLARYRARQATENGR